MIIFISYKFTRKNKHLEPGKLKKQKQKCMLEKKTKKN